MARQAVMKLIYGNTIRGIMPSKGVEKLVNYKDFYKKQYNLTCKRSCCWRYNRRKIVTKIKFLK